MEQVFIARALYSSAIIFPIACFMGATLPAVLRAVNATAIISEVFYASNTIGGAVGCLLIAVILIPLLGMGLANSVCAAINVLCAIGALKLALQARPAGPTVAAETTNSTPADVIKPAKPYLLDAIAFGAGAIYFTLQIGLTRLLASVISSSTYAMAIALFFSIAGLGLGALLVSLDKRQSTLKIGRLPLVSLAGAAWLLALLWFASAIPALYLIIYKLSLSAGAAVAFPTTIAVAICLCSLVMLPLNTVLGMTLPLIFDFGTNNSGQSVSRLYAINSFGALLGGTIAGAGILPFLAEQSKSGLQSLFALLILSLLIVFVLASAFVRAQSKVVANDERAAKIRVVAAIIIALAGLMHPPWDLTGFTAGVPFYLPAEVKQLDLPHLLASVWQPGSRNIEFYREGLNSTVSVVANAAKNILMLKTDGKAELTVPLNERLPAPQSDLATHQHLVQYACAALDEPPKRILLIGYGGGISAQTAEQCLSKYGQLTIAEIERAVYEAGDLINSPAANPLKAQNIASGRVLPLLADGRYVLDINTQPFDLIVSQPSDPWAAGCANVFTQQFWQLGRRSLTKDGAFSQWLPMYCLDPPALALVIRTFRSVFPEAVLMRDENAGEAILLGFVGAHRELGSHSLLLTSEQLDTFCNQFGAGGSQLNTDDNERLEFLSARLALSPERNIDDNIRWLSAVAKLQQ